MRTSIALFAILVATGAAPAHAQEPSFVGFDCSVDCSSHAAGYAWAAERGVTKEGDCPASNSLAFREGCLTYARGGTLEDTSRKVVAGVPVSPLDFPDDDDPTNN